ncbi:hypothetical protein A3Q56_06477 [Intoshia linei]|uniref:Protein kinase domain-containing protein n=1 Tax=Intoshia linei TaxID=1819745 RepID=A0A177AUZ4_9BILA|nr:hypothetical protein A3Q56_06477 [Intoshia linei]
MSDCSKIFCGEGGCVMQNNYPVCLCPIDLLPPDENLKCRKNKIYYNSSEIPNKSNISLIETSKIPTYMGRSPLELSVVVVLPTITFLIFITTILLKIFKKQIKNFNFDGIKHPTLHPRFEKLLSHFGSKKLNLELSKLAFMNANPNYMAQSTLNDDRNSLKIFNKDLIQIERKLGEGNFATVYKANILITKNKTITVAVKMLKDENDEKREMFISEAQVMSVFNHNNIIKLFGIYHNVLNEVNLVFEYMSYGDLNSILISNDSPSSLKPIIQLNPNHLLDFSIQICSGMEYLSKLKYIHRDLATRNCLISKKHIAKIADFGLSRHTDVQNYYRINKNVMLPIRWMSYESICHGIFDLDSDIWSFGILLWEMYSFGRNPYTGKNNEEVVEIIRKGESFNYLTLPNNEEINNIIEQSLHRVPSNRGSFTLHLKKLRSIAKLTYININ